jgi:AcrR family transcriptional regulator
MRADVKVRRRYDSSRRQAQARLSRLRILDAARILFLDCGYAATTLDTIAEAADVAPGNLYRLCRSKKAILSELIDVSIVGDDEAIALHDRGWVRAVEAEADPRILLRGFASVARRVLDGAAPIHQLIRSAAAADPEVADLRLEHNRQRYSGQSRIAHALAERKALRPDLPEASAADVIYALMSPDVYWTLTQERGWTGDQYEEWLGETLCTSLLRPHQPPPSGEYRPH